MAKPCRRCAWCGDDPLYVAYHDDEWGVPVRDDRLLFEQLILEGAQAGLSWITVLRKRERYREVFANFDPRKVARFAPAKVELWMQDAGLVRHRGKLASVAPNARASVPAPSLAPLQDGCPSNPIETSSNPTREAIATPFH